jgi:signal transduction histidine kinase
MQTAPTSPTQRPASRTYRSTTNRGRPFVTVDTVLSAVVRRVEARAEAARVQVFVNAGTGGFEGDGAALTEALGAIVLNAIEATPRGGAVVVATQELPDGSQAWGVRDFGPSTGPQSARVGGSFISRANDPAMLDARQTFEAHGGEMLVRSKGDAGTLVSMHLPRTVDDGLHAAAV